MLFENEEEFELHPKRTKTLLISIGIHVIDVSDPDREEKRQVVLDVLREIGAGDHPMLSVYNKSDLVSELPRTADSKGVLVSAATGDGLGDLIDDIVQRVSPVRV